jgi:hypothetical protein
MYNAKKQATNIEGFTQYNDEFFFVWFENFIDIYWWWFVKWFCHANVSIKLELVMNLFFYVNINVIIIIFILSKYGNCTVIKWWKFCQKENNNKFEFPKDVNTHKGVLVFWTKHVKIVV